jgi:hypothetical protein
MRVPQEPSCCKQEWVLKKYVIGMSSGRRSSLSSSFSLFQLRGSFDSGCCWLAEEAHQSLDVLSRCSKPELFPHELQSAQAQATEPDLILEFREQRFHLLSLSLRFRELGRCANSRACCLTDSWMWIARYLYRPVVHCAFCEHAPQRFALPM